MLAEVLLNYINNQIELKSLKRIALYNIPSFIQHDIYLHLSNNNTFSSTYIFTDLNKNHYKEQNYLIIAQTKEDILTQRNNPQATNIILLTSKQLDRSNETSFISLNNIVEDKWNWVTNELGEYILTSLFQYIEILEKDNREILLKCILHFGQYYENGIYVQWQVLKRLFNLKNTSPIKDYPETNLLAFGLCIPFPGTGNSLSNSIACLDSKMKFRKTSIEISISDVIEKNGLSGFKEMCLNRIDEINNNSESKEYEFLNRFKLNYCNENSQSEVPFEKFYKDAFISYWNNLANFNSKALTICNNPILYYLGDIELNTFPNWWPILTSDFWNIILNSNKKTTNKIDLIILNYFSIDFNKNILTYHESSGVVDFEILNFSDFKENLFLIRNDKKERELITGNRFSIHYTENIDKPFSISLGTNTKKITSIKILPAECFNCKIIPVLYMPGVKATMPVKKGQIWTTEISIPTRGQIRIHLLSKQNDKIEIISVLDTEDETVIPTRKETNKLHDNIESHYFTFWGEGNIFEKNYKVLYKIEDAETQLLLLNIKFDSQESTEVDSRFKQLVNNHVNKSTSGLNTQVKDTFLDIFESWIINSPEISHQPVLLSVSKIEKQILHQLEISNSGWHSLFQEITAENFIYGNYAPNINLIKCRSKIIDHLSKQSESRESIKLLRSLNISTKDKELVSLVEEYLKLYLNEVSISDNFSSKWFDIHPIINDKHSSIELLNANQIIGVIVSPYHPLRLYWQLRAQNLLTECLEIDLPEFRHNPAAATLDPSIVPDLINLETKNSIGDVQIIKFISHSNNTDYWGILLNPYSYPYLSNLNENFDFFWKKFGADVESVNQGLFSSQIERSLKDVSRLLVSHDTLKISIYGNSKGQEDEGIFNWLKNINPALSEINNSYLQEIVWGKVRPKFLEVYDKRDEVYQPNEYTLLDEYALTENNLKWYDASKSTTNNITDLSIICDIGINSIEFAKIEGIESPVLGPLLYKHRLTEIKNVGTRVPIIEQRKSNINVNNSHTSDQIFNQIINILENANNDEKSALAITPKFDLLNTALRNSHLSVVSSSLLSPSTFAFLSKNNINEELYLWDFDLPSFTTSTNSKNGYYLLAHPRLGTQTSSIILSLSKHLKKYESFNLKQPEEQKQFIQSLISEYVQKGLPSLKKLVYGGNGLRGELGNIISVRLLQGSTGINGIIPILEGVESLNLLIPIDPFQNLLKNLPRNSNDEKSRPDFILISYRQCTSGYKLKFTPIEVKYRSNNDAAWKDKIYQAKYFSTFLENLFNIGKQSELWNITFLSIMGRMIEYGLNLASTQLTKKDDISLVYKMGFSLINNLFRKEFQDKISFDKSGRLIYINANKFENDLNNVESSDIEIFEHCAYLNHNVSEAILFSESNKGDSLIKKSLLINSKWDFQPECNSEVRNQNPLNEDSSVQKEKFVENENLNISEDLDTITNEEESDFDHEVYINEFPEGLKIKVGNSVSKYSEADFFYNPGSTDITQLNIGVIGDLGTGKTQMLKSLVYQISLQNKSNRGATPKFLILDTKRDYDGSGNSLDKSFIKNINAEVLIPYKLKLNIFDIQGSTETNPALSRARFFIDILNKIYGGIGPVQKELLREAILTSYANKGYKSGPSESYENFISPTLIEIRDVYKQSVKQADVPLSIMNSLILEELFEEDGAKTISFNDLFTKSLVIALGKIANSSDSLKLLMVIFLKLYQDYMLGVTKEPYIGNNPSLRKIDSYILIDEAKLIMDYEFPVLEDLLRKGREFGVGVILSTQYLSDFNTGKIDFKQPLSTWFIHKVPNITLKDLKSIGINESSEQTCKEISNLQKHFCLYKTHNVNGKIIRGLPLYEILK